MTSQVTSQVTCEVKIEWGCKTSQGGLPEWIVLHPLMEKAKNLGLYVMNLMVWL